MCGRASREPGSVVRVVERREHPGGTFSRAPIVLALAWASDIGGRGSRRSHVSRKIPDNLGSEVLIDRRGRLGVAPARVGYRDRSPSRRLVARAALRSRSPATRDRRSALKSTVRHATAPGGWHRAMRAVDRGVRTRRTFRLFWKGPEYSGSKFWIDRAPRAHGCPTAEAHRVGGGASPPSYAIA